MNFKLAIIFLLIKVVVSSISELQISSTNVDENTQQHVINTVRSYYDQRLGFYNMAKSLVDEMNNKYGKTWISQVMYRTIGETYVDQSFDSYIYLNVREMDIQYNISLFKINTALKITDDYNYGRHVLHKINAARYSAHQILFDHWMNETLSRQVADVADKAFMNATTYLDANKCSSPTLNETSVEVYDSNNCHYVISMQIISAIAPLVNGASVIVGESSFVSNYNTGSYNRHLAIKKGPIFIEIFN